MSVVRRDEAGDGAGLGIETVATLAARRVRARCRERREKGGEEMRQTTI